MTTSDGALSHVFLVLGVKNSGSASLTYPEDFEVGTYVPGNAYHGEPGYVPSYYKVFRSEERANEIARDLNRESLRDFYSDDEELMEIINDPEWDGDTCELDLDCDDVMLYEVHPLVVE